MAYSGVIHIVFSVVFLFLSITPVIHGWWCLKTDPFNKTCPGAVFKINDMTLDVVKNDPRMGASLLRLFFHDCFVNGCDASILLKGKNSELDKPPNNGSIRGMGVIDDIKKAVDDLCGGPVISCADILAVVARTSIVALGGPCYDVNVGRLDYDTPFPQFLVQLPAPFMTLPQLIQSFKNKNMTDKDLVALSMGHSIGNVQCFAFKTRLASATNKTMDADLRKELLQKCNRKNSQTDNKLVPLDSITPDKFDTQYFKNLCLRKGVLASDQALCNESDKSAASLLAMSRVQTYSTHTRTAFEDFVYSMQKLGNLNPTQGKPKLRSGKCSQTSNK